MSAPSPSTPPPRTAKHPPEHPARLEQFTQTLSKLKWDQTSMPTTLDSLFNEVVKLVQAEIDYYYARRVAARRRSQVCRTLAWIFGSLGILMPLLQPLAGAQSTVSFVSWGYAAFGLSGIFLAHDKLFAGTQAHQRYTQSQLELEKTLTVFTLRWQSLMIEIQGAQATQVPTAAIHGAIQLANDVHKILGAETSAWQDAVNASLEDLRGRVHGNQAQPSASAEGTALAAPVPAPAPAPALAAAPAPAGSQASTGG